MSNIVRHSVLFGVMVFASSTAVTVPLHITAGCYKDKGNVGSHQPGRQMQIQICEATDMCTKLTHESCALACRQANYSLYGVEAGHQCFCDNALAHPDDTLPLSACSTACTGNVPGIMGCTINEACGASDALFVAQVDGVPLPKNCTPLQPTEPRNTMNGTIMFSYGYLDQPYCQVNPANNEWTCITTASAMHEGGTGEHIISQVSTDEGTTWSTPVSVEPGVSVDNSYGTLAMSKTGRLYCIYNMNLDNITKLPDGTSCTRTDELGHFVMKYSDDGGRTWCKDRIEVPYRLTPLDMTNSWMGKVKIMWNVDQVKTIDGSDTIIYGFTKIGHYVQNAPQELWFLTSDNLATETNASKITWKLLPDGDHGILPPGVTAGPPADPVGDILEEAHIVPLKSGGFYVVGRTTQGFLGATHTNGSVETGLNGWEKTGYANYWNVTEAAAGRFVGLPPTTPVRAVGAMGYGLKNPRGPITPKRMQNGLYLLLFYNDGGGSFGQRDPYWLTCGREVPGYGILWSQPEIVLYDRYEHTREAGGYPDFIQSQTTGAIFITETQKSVARIHRIEDSLLSALWTQHNTSVLAPGSVATITASTTSFPTPSFSSVGDWKKEGQGFSFSLVLDNHANAKAGEVILDARKPPLTQETSTGVAVVVGENNSVSLWLSDGATHAGEYRAVFETDPLCSRQLKQQGKHHVGIVVDAGPMVATFVVDGLVCDGGHAGSAWTSGWFWIPPFSTFECSDSMHVGTCAPNDVDKDATTVPCAKYSGQVVSGHVYDRMLYNSEMIGNYRASGVHKLV